jgi:hypothetical protein
MSKLNNIKTFFSGLFEKFFRQVNWKRLFDKNFLPLMLRNFFLSITLRERIMFAAFLWVLVMLWGGTWLKEFRVLRNRLATTSRSLQSQNEWLKEKGGIEQQLQAALQRLDPKKTFTSPRLTGKIDEIARQNELNYILNSPMTTKGEIFDVHTVRIQIKHAELGKLLAFDNDVKQESPYLGVEQVQISADSRDPRYLDVQFVISSFELIEKIL